MARPYILTNFAVSADGKIGNSQRDPSRFTSKNDLERLLRIRSRADAILVGRGTLEADNMSMTIPTDRNPPKSPLRCIISRSGKFDPTQKVFHSPGGNVHLVISEPTSDFDSSSFEKLGARIHQVPLNVFLQKTCPDLGVNTLLCEGGGSLAKELFALDAIDEINLTIAGHTLIGGAGSPTITGIPSQYLADSRQFTLSHFEPTPDGELFLTYHRIP